MERMMKTLDPVGEIREVLIAATDMVPVGEEPYVGWSAVLAERIAAALGLDDLDAAEERMARAMMRYEFEGPGLSALHYGFPSDFVHGVLEAALTGVDDVA